MLQASDLKRVVHIVHIVHNFRARRRAEAALALANGKTVADQRATIKERDWKRDQQRIMRDYK